MMNQPEQQRAKRILPITAIVTFIGFLDTTLLIPVIALYAASLGADVGVIGLIVGLYSITNTPANILFGRLIDRIGYKIPLVTGLIGDALGMLFYFFSGLPIHLALVRAFHGASGGLVGPATMSIFARQGEKAEGRTMSIYGISLASATLIGFALSGFITSRWGYKIIFLLGAGLLGIGSLLALLLPANRKKANQTTRVSTGTTFEQVKSLFNRRSLIVSYSSIFAQYFTFGGVVTLLPIYLNGLGMEVFHMGMLLSIFAIMFIIVQFPSGALSDRAGRLVPTISALGLSIISLALLPASTTFLLLAVAMGLYGTAYGLLFPSISAIVADDTSPEERGLATGLFHALLTTGVAIGAPVIGWLGEGLGIRTGLAFIPSITILALIIALTALKRS